VEKINTHIYVQELFIENHSFFEIKWKNIVEPGRP